VATDQTELLARARAYEEAHQPPLPTRAELEATIARCLEELERVFPNGEPKAAESAWRGLRYQILRLRLQGAEYDLRDEGFAPEARPSFALIEGGWR
jgi:hypothetical protein